SGAYIPLTEDEAIKRCARLIALFERHKVRVIRCGLHPSEGLVSGREHCAGPFHTAFRQKVETYIYYTLFKHLSKEKKSSKKIQTVYCNSKEAGSVIGYARSNAIYAQRAFGKGCGFKASRSVKQGTIRLRFNNGKYMTLKKLGAI
ncbi:MAG: hypothetical protein ABH875_00690, partial [Candidatus Omnitrophota bacterium]